MMHKSRGFDFIEDAIANNVEQAALLKLRNQLMDKAIDAIREKGWTFPLAAKNIGLTEPRLNELLQNKISKFSLEDLVGVLARMDISIELKQAYVK